MAKSESPPPESLQNPTTTTAHPPPESDRKPDFSFSSFLQQRPKIRVTSEYDSDSAVFFHKISCKLLDNLAKLKFTFHNDGKNKEISEPRIALVSKYLSLHYDIDQGNTLVNSAFNVGPGLQFKAAHDFKAQQGQVAVVTDFLVPEVKIELASAIPSVGRPKSTVNFPFGQLSFEDKYLDAEDEVNREKIVAVNGILKGPVLSGIGVAQFSSEDLSLRYSYKDEQMTFIPTVSLPSNSFAFAFKRRLSPSDKLSYWYNFDSNYWSTVYKHTVGKDFKVKAGYDSEVRLGWASLWVGDENGKAKTAPIKMKLQFMLQVPQDDIKSSALMFRVKKRWDI